MNFVYNIAFTEVDFLICKRTIDKDFLICKKCYIAFIGVDFAICERSVDAHFVICKRTNINESSVSLCPLRMAITALYKSFIIGIKFRFTCSKSELY